MLRNTVAVLLIISVGTLGLLLVKQTSALQEKQRQIQELNAKLDSIARATNLEKVASFDLQEKCARQAREEFNSQGYTKKPLAHFSNHYNAALGKRFIEIDDTDTKLDPGTVWQSKFIVDAYESKEYGEYMWHSDKVKKYWEVPPVECHALSISGENKICNSEDEFTALIKSYME